MADFEMDMDIITEIESSKTHFFDDYRKKGLKGGKRGQYGELISSAGAFGIAQIKEAVVKDYMAMKLGRDWKQRKNRPFLMKLIQKARKEPAFNRKVGNWFINERIPSQLRRAGAPDTPITRAGAYNGGFGTLTKAEFNVNKMLPEAQNYAVKYIRLNTEKQKEANGRKGNTGIREDDSGSEPRTVAPIPRRSQSPAR